MFLRMSPPMIENLCRAVAREVEKLTAAHHAPILLVSPQIRAALKEMTAAQLPNLVVLSYNEITRDTRIESISMVTSAN
jgi:flagellar biosynthesis protein FlhA